MNTPDAVGRHYTPICPICNEPVDLRNGKTDGSGRAVHEDCYAGKLSAASVPEHTKPSWEELASQLEHEENPDKVLELSRKLQELLLAREQARNGH